MMRLAPGTGPESNATGRIDVTVPNADVNGVGLLLTGGGEITGTIRMDEGELKDAYGSAACVAGQASTRTAALAWDGRWCGGSPHCRRVWGEHPLHQSDDKGTFKLTVRIPGRTT